MPSDWLGLAARAEAPRSQGKDRAGDPQTPWIGLSALKRKGAWVPGGVAPGWDGAAPLALAEGKPPWLIAKSRSPSSKAGSGDKTSPSPPPFHRQGFCVRPSDDGLCQRATGGIKPTAARGGWPPADFHGLHRMDADRPLSRPAIRPQADLNIPPVGENARF
jgi:hypothetical protein